MEVFSPLQHLLAVPALDKEQLWPHNTPVREVAGVFWYSWGN